MVRVKSSNSNGRRTPQHFKFDAWDVWRIRRLQEYLFTLGVCFLVLYVAYVLDKEQRSMDAARAAGLSIQQTVPSPSPTMGPLADEGVNLLPPKKSRQEEEDQSTGNPLTSTSLESPKEEGESKGGSVIEVEKAAAGNPKNTLSPN